MPLIGFALLFTGIILAQAWSNLNKKQLGDYKSPNCSNGNITANASPTKNQLGVFVFVPNDGG